MAQDPDYAKTLSNLGLILHELGRLGEAETHLRRAIALDPHSPDAHLNLGTVLYKQGRYEEALAVARSAVAQDPDAFKAHINLGAVLSELEHLEEAETHLRRALALNPRDIDLFQQSAAKLAEVLRAQGRGAEALDALAEAVALDSASAQAAELHFLMGLAAEEDAPAAAAASYRHAIAIAPQHTKAIRRLAHLTFEQQGYAEAVELFQRLIAIDSGDAVAYGNMGIALFYLGRNDAALKSFDRALSLDPTLASARANREAVLAVLAGKK